MTFFSSVFGAWPFKFAQLMHQYASEIVVESIA